MIVGAVITNHIGQFVVTLVIFALVLALTYFTTRFVGSHQKKYMSHGNIKIVESFRLSNSKVLEIVKAGDKTYLIAVCKDTVTCIGEVNEESLDLSTPEKNTPESFGNVFSRFRVNSGKEEEDEQEK